MSESQCHQRSRKPNMSSRIASLEDIYELAKAQRTIKTIAVTRSHPFSSHDSKALCALMLRLGKYALRTVNLFLSPWRTTASNGRAPSADGSGYWKRKKREGCWGVGTELYACACALV